MALSRITAALVLTLSLIAAPALAGEQDTLAAPRDDAWTDSPSPQQQISDEEFHQYMQSLRRIGRWQPLVAAALRRGEAMDRRLLDQTTWQEKLHGLREIQQTGLTCDRFLEIAQRINQEAPLRQRYYQHLRLAMATPGAD